eukprot:3940537-Rhodomonas_salina.2
MGPEGQAARVSAGSWTASVVSHGEAYGTTIEVRMRGRVPYLICHVRLLVSYIFGFLVSRLDGCSSRVCAFASVPFVRLLASHPVSAVCDAMSGTDAELYQERAQTQQGRTRAPDMGGVFMAVHALTWAVPCSSTLDPHPCTLNPKPQTPNPKPQTPNPKP